MVCIRSSTDIIGDCAVTVWQELEWGRRGYEDSYGGGDGAADRRTVEEFGVSLESLMERAGARWRGSVCGSIRRPAGDGAVREGE